MRTFITIIFLLFISSRIIPQWERSNGPEGISIYSLACIDNVLYAGTRTDGLYASTDEGSTWYALNSGLEKDEINAIASSNNTLLVGTYLKGVYHSIDGGQTWLPSSNYNSGVTVNTITVKDQYVFAGTSAGLLRSSDNGVTWEDISFLPYYESVTEMCTTGDKLIATDFGSSYASTDNGETWTTIESIGYGIFSLYAKGDTVFAGGQSEIYRSFDGGDVFILIEIPFSFSIVNIYSMTYIGQDLFMGTSYDGIYKSTDNGAFWSPANIGMGPKDVRALTVTQSSTLIAGSYYAGVYKSTDNGLNWNKSVSGFPAGSSILSMYNSGYGVLAGTRDGLFKTTDNGASWIKLTGESDTINYGEVRGVAAREQEIYAAITYQFNGIVYKSTDLGETWKRSGDGFASDISFMSGIAVSGNNIVAGSDQGLYYSTDDGSSWLLSNQTEGYYQQIAVTHNYIYAQRMIGGISRSSDNGVTWLTVYSPPSVFFTGTTAMDNSAYAAAEDIAAYYSTDNGNNWYPAGFPTGSSVYAIQYIPAVPGMVLAGTNVEQNYIYASFNNSHVFSPYSEGFGDNAYVEALTSNDQYSFAGTDFNGVWRRFLPGIIPVELASFAVNVDKNSAVLTWQTVTETNNSGFEIERKRSGDKTGEGAWEMIGFVEGHGTSTKKHTYGYTDKDLDAGKYYYRLKQTDTDGSYKYSNTVKAIVDVPAVFSLEQNYPNPFNPSTSFRYSVPNLSKVTIKVFDALGNEIAVLVNEKKQAGTYEVKWNAAKLASGVYYYQLRSKPVGGQIGNFAQTKKMILLK